MNTILVPLDGSELSAQALPFASAFGKLLSAELCLLHVLTAGDEQDFVFERERLPLSEPSGAYAHAAAYLEEQAVQLREQGLLAHTEVIAGRPHEAIVEAADQRDATLVIMATHGRGSLGRWLAGSVAHNVLGLTNRPLLAIRSIWPHPPGLSRILVPLDGSSLACEALPMALKLAKLSGASLVLFSVLPPRYGLQIPEVPPALLGDELQEEGERLLNKLHNLVPEHSGVQVTAVLGEGFVGQAICRESEKANLIVMTRHGYTGRRGFALGSVIDEVLHGTRVPVLIIPERSGEV